jgi:hypothetical protein
MSSYAIATASPFMQFVSRGNNPLNILVTELPGHCYLCNHESKSLFILTFNMLACQGCFDFALSCNFFNNIGPIDHN